MKPNAHQLYLAACERLKPRGFSPEVIAAFQVVRAVVVVAAISTPAHAVQIQHHDAAGQPVTVTVINERCPDGVAEGCYLQHVIWTGGNSFNLAHELAHVAGMRHSPWQHNRWGIPCATVTVAGFETGYQVGQVICNTLRGEFVEAR